MKRLTLENTNTGPEYDKIFHQRQEKGINWQDARRWRTLLKYFKGGNILDIGCLDSVIPISALAMFPKTEAWGIDIAEKTIANMKTRYPEVNYEVRNLYETKFLDNQFDYIVMGEVIEHLENPKEAIKEAMRILKPGGRLALSTPLKEEIEPGAVDHVHHLWSFTTQDVIEMLKPYGGVITKILGTQHFPVYKYCWPSIIAFGKKK